MKTIRLCFSVVVAVIEACLWAAFGVKLVGQVGAKLVRHREALMTGELVCSAGHVVDLAGGNLVECSSCKFVSDEPGAALFCPNPYCEAPVAPYVVCQVCGRSVVNPMARVLP